MGEAGGGDGEGCAPPPATKSVNSKWSRVMARACDWPCELLDRARALWDQGLTATEVGERLGKSRGAIMGKLARARKQGHIVHTRTIANPKPPKKFNTPKKIKNSVVSAVPREATNGRGKRQTVPPIDAVSPPPIPSPLPTLDEWDGIVAEVFSIQNSQCKWPLGEPVAGFCRMQLTHRRSPYCDYHASVARRKVGHSAGE